MTDILYFEINMFCIVILTTILYKVHTGSDKHDNQRIFHILILEVIIFFIMDSLWSLIEGGYWQASITMNYIINVLYYICIGIGAFLWFLYSEREIQSEVIQHRKYLVLSCLPLSLLIVLILISCKTGLIFYIDKENVYHRGNGHSLQVILTYGYIGFAVVHALIKVLKKENNINRSRYLNLIVFAVIPIAFGMIQTMFFGVPALCIGITLGILYVYINTMEQKISVDPLTQLNNRSQLLKYLSSKMKSYDSKKKLYLLIIDANHFKKINDQYGHIEGDTALLRIANVLKQICAQFGYFACRYGGDEFILVCEVESKADIERLCQNINDAIEINNRAAGSNYRLSVSIGYAQYKSNIKSISEFIVQADKTLYREKKIER